jgi:DNA-binding CsgD family transcriptional regulator
MAELLSASARTVEVHRDNIRKKLGLRNKKANLKSHLMAL